MSQAKTAGSEDVRVLVLTGPEHHAARYPLAGWNHVNFIFSNNIYDAAVALANENPQGFLIEPSVLSRALLNTLDTFRRHSPVALWLGPGASRVRGEALARGLVPVEAVKVPQRKVIAEGRNGEIGKAGETGIIFGDGKEIAKDSTAFTPSAEKPLASPPEVRYDELTQLHQNEPLLSDAEISALLGNDA